MPFLWLMAFNEELHVFWILDYSFHLNVHFKRAPDISHVLLAMATTRAECKKWLINDRECGVMWCRIQCKYDETKSNTKTQKIVQSQNVMRMTCIKSKDRVDQVCCEALYSTRMLQLQQYLHSKCCHMPRLKRTRNIVWIQRVWRKTIVLTKTKPKCKLPKLFRADRLTGLPVDYERTVSRIMHYVNPHLSSSPSPDQLMEQLLTRTLVSYVGNWKCSNRSPQFLKHHMRSILRDQAPQSLQENIRNDRDLGQFHCACKRKPVPAETLIPTYKSKFNYNNLKIKSK
ncbi:hypothetical protein ACLKA6_019084 [Drosophila palustris]